MSHHSSNVDDKVNEQFEKLFGEKLGPTGKFPNGRLTPTDEGEFKLAVAHKDGVVIVDFGKPVAWIGFRKEEIRAFIDLLEKHASEVGAGRTNEAENVFERVGRLCAELFQRSGTKASRAYVSPSDFKAECDRMQAKVEMVESKPGYGMVEAVRLFTPIGTVITVSDAGVAKGAVILDAAPSSKADANTPG